MNTRHYYLRLLRTFALAALTAACTDDNGGFTVAWKGTDNDPTGGYYDLIDIRAAQGTTTIGSKTYVPTTSAASSALKPVDDRNKLTLSSTGEWTFTAVYGATGNESGISAANVSLLTQSAPGNTNHIARRDFSVATATKMVQTGGMPQDINLKFEHKLSALQLHVTNETAEALTVREIRLSVAGAQITYLKVYDIATGDWEADGGRKSDYLLLTIASAAELASGGTEPQKFHMLLFPGYENTNMTITVITDRGEFALTKPAPTGGFLAGHNYLTKIAVKTSGLQSNETWTEHIGISTVAELAAFRDKVNNGDNYAGKTVRLTANIDLTNETWTPIGTDDSKPFSGTFDGAGHFISNLSVNSTVYAGLFGYINNGTVRNLRVSVSDNMTTTASYAGSIAGILYGSTVENCIFSGTVKGQSYAGGIAGVNMNNSRIAGCHTKGTVTAGGIAGDNVNSTVTYCYATGAISGNNYVGGIAGYTDGGTFTGCIALNPGLTRTEGIETTFGRIAGDNYENAATFPSCAAYDGMTIKDANGTDFYTTATGKHGDPLTAAECLTATTYTSRSFTTADATTSGWAFDTATPWTYLPWNPAFALFPGITEADYRISVPAHLKVSVVP